MDILEENLFFKSSEKATKLLFFFHGYGSDNSNLSYLGKSFSKLLIATDVVLPNGIESCNEGNGRQWFSLSGESNQDWNNNYLQNEAIIISKIKKIMEEQNVDFNNVIFAGFSQGAMLAISLGVKYNVSAVISFSGALLTLQKSEKCSTKVLLLHGQQDSVLPIDSLYLAEKALKNENIYVESFVNPTMAHSIEEDVFYKAVDFLKSLDYH